jgi:hypothetical protein
VSQIGLVSNQHDDNVTVGMVSQLFEPSGDVLVCLVLADIVDEQGTDGAAVVSRGDGAVTLLASGIPDLSLDGLVVDLDAACSKLDTDGRLRIKVELVAGETAQEVGFTDTRISDQDDLEEELRELLVVGWRQEREGERGSRRTRRWP